MLHSLSAAPFQRLTAHPRARSVVRTPLPFDSVKFPSHRRCVSKICLTAPRQRLAGTDRRHHDAGKRDPIRTPVSPSPLLTRKASNKFLWQRSHRKCSRDLDNQTILSRSSHSSYIALEMFLASRARRQVGNAAPECQCTVLCRRRHSASHHRSDQPDHASRGVGSSTTPRSDTFTDYPGGSLIQQPGHERSSSSSSVIARQ